MTEENSQEEERTEEEPKKGKVFGDPMYDVGF